MIKIIKLGVERGLAIIIGNIGFHHKHSLPQHFYNVKYNFLNLIGKMYIHFELNQSIKFPLNINKIIFIKK